MNSIFAVQIARHGTKFKNASLSKNNQISIDFFAFFSIHFNNSSIIEHHNKKTPQRVFFCYGESIQASSDDWEANRRGWRGAKAEKNLLESCSRNPRDYYK